MATNPNSTNYQTNPLKLVWSGVKKLYSKSRVTFWVLFVLSAAGAVSNLTDPGDTAQPPKDTSLLPEPSTTEALAILGLVLFVIFVAIALMVVVWGIIGYSAAQLAHDKKFTLKEAFDASLENFERMFLIGVVVFVRIIGWTLLFIIPGIIMAVRYSLSAVVAFAEPDLQPGQVVSRSAQLTKGAWFDTFATRYILSILSLGFLDMNADTAAQSQLYRQLKTLKETNAQKPKTHILSYLTLIVPSVIVVVGLVLLMANLILIDQYAPGYLSSQMK